MTARWLPGSGLAVATGAAFAGEAGGASLCEQAAARSRAATKGRMVEEHSSRLRQRLRQRLRYKSGMNLSVNLNKVALLRNSRGGVNPAPRVAAETCIRAGAAGLTLHWRE